MSGFTWPAWPFFAWISLLLGVWVGATVVYDVWRGNRSEILEGAVGALAALFTWGELISPTPAAASCALFGLLAGGSIQRWEHGRNSRKPVSRGG